MYDLNWNSAHPGHVVFLIDMSGAMAADNKINYVIDAVQDSIETLLAHCMKGNGLLAERVSVSVYGYNYHIVELWINYGVKQMAKAMIEAEDAGVKIFDSNGEAKPEYQRCMRLAFEEAKKDVEQWIQCQNGKTDIPAPVVINITCGGPFEGGRQDQVYADTLKAAQELMRVTTTDGSVRLLNIHYDPGANKPSLAFPLSMPKADKIIQFLFQVSSPLTVKMATVANVMGFPEAREGSRSIVSNIKNPSIVTRFLLGWEYFQRVNPEANAC